MGEYTTLSIATSKKQSLRTTVPMSIVKQFNLQGGDKLEWIFDIKDGEIVILVKPIKRSG